MFTKEYLEECFSYNKDSGELIWKQRPRFHFASDRAFKTSNSRFSGKVAGSIGVNGYVEVRVNSKLLLAHRVVWMLKHGVIPDQIDHIDGNRSNNRIINLRDVPQSVNAKNQKRRKSNSGVTGVYWSNISNAWNPRITVRYKEISLGYYLDKFEAICARKAAENKYGFHENHGTLR